MHRYESVYTRSLGRWLLLQNYALCLPMERLHCILLRVNLSGVVPAYIRYNNIQNKKPYMKIIGRTYNTFYKICISRTVCTSGITTDNVHMLAQCILYTQELLHVNIYCFMQWTTLCFCLILYFVFTGKNVHLQRTKHLSLNARVRCNSKQHKTNSDGIHLNISLYVYSNKHVTSTQYVMYTIIYAEFCSSTFPCKLYLRN